MRTRNSFYNMLTNLIPGLIISALGLIKMPLIKEAYGVDLYGMNLYLAQVIAYLNLVEGGFGDAFLQAMFKPLAEKDNQKVRELYWGADFLLKMCGLIILALGVIVMFLLPMLLKTELNFGYVRAVFLLLLLPTAIDYFLMAPVFVIQADQQEYHINLIRKTIQVLRILTHILVVKLQLDYIYIPLTEALYILAQIFMVRKTVFKKYGWLKEKAKRDFSTIQAAKEVFVHRIAGTVLTSTDTLLLGAFIGTSANTLYGNYHYITGEMQKILNNIVKAPKASMGNLFALKDEKAYAVFKEYFSFSAFLATCVCIPTCVTISCFMEYWQGKDMVLTVLDAFLFAGILYFILVREPIMVVRDTSGLFKESKKFAMMEAALNFTFSVIGVYFFGITGALIVTFLTYLVSDLFMNARLVYKTVFDLSIIKYYVMYFTKLIVALLVGAGSFVFWIYVLEPMVSGILMWFVAAGCLFVFETVILFAIYYFLFLEFRQFMNRVKGLLIRKAGA